MDSKERIRALIGDILKNRGDVKPFRDEDSLIASGRLDSLNVLEIVGYLEREFQLDIAALDFDPTLFDSVDRITALIQPRTASGFFQQR